MVLDKDWLKGKHYVKRIDNSLICQGADTPSFLYGIELINDDITPMEFVVKTLINNTFIDQHDATSAMLTVHALGRVVINVNNKEDAFQISEKIVFEARNNNYPLICKPYYGQQSIPDDAN